MKKTKKEIELDEYSKAVMIDMVVEIRMALDKFIKDGSRAIDKAKKRLEK